MQIRIQPQGVQPTGPQKRDIALAHEGRGRSRRRG
nr:MAG TPA: hypothetical protein [Caudoviricetes sp.]